MKKLKNLGFLFLGALFITSLAACNKENLNVDNNLNGDVTNQTGNPEKYPEVIFKELDETKDIRFSSVSVNTSKAKTVFYLGEEFTYEGLVVTTNFLVFENGVRVDSLSYETKNYSIDYSEVNLNAVGEYPVIISYRDGTNVKTTSYTVSVKTALFETTPNITYKAGVKIGFTAANSSDPLIKTIYVKDAYTFNVSQLSYELFTKTNDENCIAELTSEKIATRFISIDNFTTNLDVNKVGTYTIRFTYKCDNVFIGDEEYENVVNSFVLVNVINPVTAIEKVSTNDTDIISSADKLDLSNWQFKVTRKVDVGEEIINYSDSLFILSGLNKYVTGSQTAVLTFRESTEDGDFLKVEVPVNVIESTTYNIYVYKDIVLGMTPIYNESNEINGYDIKTDSERVSLDENNIIYAQNITREFKVRECDGLNFSIRTKFNDSTSYFEINMANPGKIVLYASTSGDVKSFSVINEDGDSVFEDTLTIKDIPERFEIVINEAGIYRIKCSSTMYVNGCVVAIEKTAE
ncbi:MAG: hypothetical protein ACI35S_06660 [Anaeroplasma sp.]